MDLTPVVNSFVSTFLYIIPLLALVIFLKSPFMKGFFGEAIVNISASLLLNKNDYRLIKNVTLPTENGTTQIDHIIVSRYGVFVVETKNMKGWIFGGPHQKTWTQKIYRHTNKFQNPLHQNYKHVQTLKSLLGLNNQQIHSLIVFVGDSTFKTAMPANVTYGFGYIRFIKSNLRWVLSEEEVERIVDLTKTGRLTPSFKTNRDHVKNLRNNAREKQIDNLCPICGSQMVLRVAKKGPNTGNKFWGCSKFPGCRGAVTI